MNPSNHCRTSISEEEFKFQYARGDIHIHIAMQKSFWHFCQSGSLIGSANMDISLDIRNRNTFRTSSRHCQSIGSFKDELDIYNWIYMQCTIGYSPQLSWNWRAPNRVGFFNGFELFVRLELFRISYFSSKSCVC